MIEEEMNRELIKFLCEHKEVDYKGIKYDEIQKKYYFSFEFKKEIK